MTQEHSSDRRIYTRPSTELTVEPDTGRIILTVRVLADEYEVTLSPAEARDLSVQLELARMQAINRVREAGL